MRKSKIYKYAIPTRFSDLDTYNHVNTKHYIDFVMDSRLYFFKDISGLSLHDLANKGVGFYTTNFEINYFRPIQGLREIIVESFIGEFKDKNTFNIPFKIYDPESQKVFAQGSFICMVVDTRTGKPRALPEELEDYFFEEEAPATVPLEN